jgi:hypothetical protein
MIKPAFVEAGMQIKLFPDERRSPETETDIRVGQVGPIRFGATPTSYAHLRRALAALTTGTDPQPVEDRIPD